MGTPCDILTRGRAPEYITYMYENIENSSALLYYNFIIQSA